MCLTINTYNFFNESSLNCIDGFIEQLSRQPPSPIYSWKENYNVYNNYIHYNFKNQSQSRSFNYISLYFRYCIKLVCFVYVIFFKQFSNKRY